MKYLPVITLGVLCAAGPALHSCNNKESGSDLKCDHLLAHRHPIPRPWSSKRVRRSFDEPVGSQASPFAPPESSDPSGARPKPKPLPRVSRSGESAVGRGSSSGPFTPPGEERGAANSRKKSHRGGWTPHDDHDHHHGHVVEEEVIEEEEEEPYVDEYKPPLLNPASDGHIKIKSHRPPPDPHWSEKHEEHPWDDKHHDDHGWKEEAQYKINDVKLRIPPVKFRFHLSPNVKIISGSKDPLQRPPPPEPEEHFPWEKPKDLPHLPWWPDEEWPEKKNCTEESNKDRAECKEEKSNISKSANLTSKSSNKKSVEKRRGSRKTASTPPAKSRSSQRAAPAKKEPKKKSTSSSARRSNASNKKKDRVTKRSGEPEPAASSRHQHQLRLKPRRTRRRKGWASEAYHGLPASPWAAPRPTWGDDVIEEHVEYDDDEDDESKNAHRGSDAEGDANKNSTAEDPPINWQDSPIHFAAHKRRWPPDTPRYSPTFKLKVHPRIWTEAPPTTTTTTTEPTTTTEEENDSFAENTTENSNDDETTTEETTTEETTTESTTTESTTSGDETTTTESTTTTTESTTTTTESGETSTRFREPTTPDQGDSTPMPSTTTETPSTTSEATTVTEMTTEAPTTTEMPSTTLAPTTTERATTTTLPTTTEETSTQRSNSDAPLRKKGSRIPKVFTGNDVSSKTVKEEITTPLPPSTTVSGTTTSWLFGLTNTTTEFNPNLEREDPQIMNRNGKPAEGVPHPRRRLVPLSPVKIDVSSPEELAGVAVNAKVLHLFLGGPNSTSLHDSVVTVAKAVNQYNNYYKRR